MAASGEHRPVLYAAALEAISVRPDGIYMDGTFGRGGHSRGILQALAPGGRLIAIDKDPDAVAWGRHRFGGDGRFVIEQGSFAMLERFAEQHGVVGKVSGILLDLGVSSPQLDRPERGFSFLNDGPLDMRMDNSGGVSAREWIASARPAEMAQVIKTYGEERFGKRIAHAIEQARAQAPIETTVRLAEIVAAAMPVHEKGRHPATRTFQAIRIFINRELDDLRDCLEQSLRVLAPGGRLAVISFHSLEDRIVKRFMRDQERGASIPKGVPVTQTQLAAKLRRVGGSTRPALEEVQANPRARSAVLRVAEVRG
ncbi:MAG: 16S rRNA (cytosine(1402)-N(4))-methyltransferase [Candidatus Sedimenticola endophacoides]|uniref:Ribosomal RNA small subunit methyltransferase H n=1 Tax=Candidatus Sedimenticola endophacoides TaxID=2548426 RepID=A0A657PML3_9GAMM|nr:MAG: 16S rRNA (cytosine(1402)-N(4))-methyltransferase [Candidatus Sedimenticola endophacoides]OQX32691.1 MAG: 16S rRNA (cytosine(1402)-N(4))-methyltransferase [Candidatus Sedimenticola endophacoides]OQX40076.1 MAG: 16S rRNA (cytosine(1402)-N(4))-methyltransferase [Candidatus Sedimenticola endophacoides]OQX40686.1 MAG: 16S rRNA (cytosine(1402)-N(4))-methyltransferase [Candidatus Sedimenticola endophacoides]OQX48903.1 MAG: 16S rRNA (cytosine(1402)-N(4))-methyltransferase [Candidatus Sedimentic